MSDLSAVTSRLPRTTLMTTIHVDGRPFRCSTDMAEHCLSVFRGEYDPGPLEFATPPRVLDIGANYGAFALWAESRWPKWPKAFIQCYEPNPETFKTLQANVGAIGAVTHPVAVRATAGKAFLRFGKNNCGESGFHDLGEQREDGVEVECIAASELPDCDVLKCDVEGDEVGVIVGYTKAFWCGKREALPKVIMFEFHSEKIRENLDGYLVVDYRLVRGTIRSADRGVLCYVRRM